MLRRWRRRCRFRSGYAKPPASQGGQAFSQAFSLPDFCPERVSAERTGDYRTEAEPPELGRRLRMITEKIASSGEQLLTLSQLERELAERAWRIAVSPNRPNISR